MPRKSRRARRSTGKKELGTLLTVWLCLMLVANIVSTAIYFGASSYFSVLMPDYPGWSAYVLGVLTLLNIIYTVQLFEWKRWGFYGFVVTTVVSMGVNVILGLGLYSFLGLLGPLILFALLQPKWNLFE